MKTSDALNRPFATLRCKAAIDLSFQSKINNAPFLRAEAELGL
jgi:hypothetical protein